MASQQLSKASLKKNWGWLLGLGILFVILGTIGLGMSVGLTIVSMLFFGILLILGGLSQAAELFQHQEWRGALWQAFISVLYIVGGVIVIYDPILASSIITMMLAAILIVIGVSRLLMALFLRKELEGWGWILFAGLCALTLGILILMQWPVSALWVIGLFIAIELIITGWSYILIALSVRK